MTVWVLRGPLMNVNKSSNVPVCLPAVLLLRRKPAHVSCWHSNHQCLYITPHTQQYWWWQYTKNQAICVHELLGVCKQIYLWALFWAKWCPSSFYAKPGYEATCSVQASHRKLLLEGCPHSQAIRATGMVHESGLRKSCKLQILFFVWARKC